jgi:L-alanine-DL-glutamate epimerase-like enolase superfamily enzyme
MGWPGYGSHGKPGPLEDAYNLAHAPGDLAQELLEEGFSGLKAWPFDAAAHAHGGMRISLADLNKALRPLYEIRERVGDRIEILVDGHGFFMLPAALRIADGLRDLRPLWAEDILKMDNIETLANFRRQSQLPISASEMLLSRADFAQVLSSQAADFIQIDPTWAGGISETVRLAHLAQGYNVPTSMHDCTGPLTLFAGLHVNAAVAGCCYQEVVRAHIRTFYSDLIEPNITLSQGHALLPRTPGLGTRLNPDLFTEENPTYRISRR